MSCTNIFCICFVTTVLCSVAFPWLGSFSIFALVLLSRWVSPKYFLWGRDNNRRRLDFAGSCFAIRLDVWTNEESLRERSETLHRSPEGDWGRWASSAAEQGRLPARDTTRVFRLTTQQWSGKHGLTAKKLLVNPSTVVSRARMNPSPSANKW